MERDCLILADDYQDPIASFARSTLDGEAEVALLSAEELEERAKCQTLAGVEMGVLIVPIRKEMDPAGISKQIETIRASGAHIRVIGLTEVCLSATEMPLGDFCDNLTSLELPGAAALLRRSLRDHRQGVENRGFKAFLEATVDGYWIWNAGDGRLEWSSRACTMMNVRPENAPTSLREFLELVHPDDVEAVNDVLTAHINDGVPITDFKLRIKNSANGYGNFIGSGQAQRDYSGRAIMLVGSLTDQTHTLQVERKLQDTQRRFATLFEQMNDAVVLADVETGKIVEVNPGAELLWGRPIDQLIGLHQSQLHPPDLAEEVKKLFIEHVKAIKSNNLSAVQAPIVRADGTVLPTDISSAVVELAGRPTVLAVFRDMSQREKAEQELRERDAQLQLASHLAAIGTLAAGVAHEINNPLTYVLGNLDLINGLLAEDGVKSPKVTEAIEAAMTGGRFLREIVSDLKSISRTDAAEPYCDPCEVVRVASRMAMSDLRHRAQLDMDLASVPKVAIASARLSQVVLNILSNATRAFKTPDRANNLIKIEVAHVGPLVKLSIEDNGKGISQADLKRVAEPFFTRNGRSGGTGLGLAISRRLLDEIGGSLDISSEENVGTKVTVWVPLAEVEEAENDSEAEMTVTEPLGGRATVMVVDDDPLVTTLVDRMLQTDFDVTTYNDARVALKDLDEGSIPEVIICDMMMPEMDGMTFYEQCDFKDRFLFLTGGAVTPGIIAFERRIEQQGRLMHKPFQAADLRKKLEAVRLEISAGDAGTNDAVSPPESEQDWTPAEATIAELEELLGRDTLKGQIELLSGQVEQFAAAAAEISTDALAADAHKVAGAADVLGFLGLGKKLREIQHRAADGERDQAMALVNSLSGAQKGLNAFIASY